MNLGGRGLNTSFYQKKRVVTKNFTVFIQFWRFNAFFDEAFTVTSRSKTIAALRLCVLDGNGTEVSQVTTQLSLKIEK
jgi:hypothetical protein